eukprot:scpid6418/ scgid20070/ Plexin A3
MAAGATRGRKLRRLLLLALACAAAAAATLSSCTHAAHPSPTGHAAATAAVAMTAAGHSYSAFSGSPGDVFTSVLVHEYTGNVYIGGKGRLWQLSKDLSGARSLTLGSVNDSLSCGPPPLQQCSTAFPRYQQRQYFVLALHADYANGNLVVCGNVYRGACRLLPLSDITSGGPTQRYLPSRDGFVVPPVLTTPSLISSTLSTDGKKMFVATPSFSGDGKRNPVIRTLSTETYRTLTNYSEMLIKNSGDNFPSAWRTAFTAANYVYFVYTEQIDGRKSKPTTTLVRICSDDGGYKRFRYHGYGSYVEMQYGYTTKTSSATGSYAQAVLHLEAGENLVGNAPAGALNEDRGIVVTAFDDLKGGSLISILSLHWVNDDMSEREVLCKQQSVQAGTENVGSIKMTKCNGYHTENNDTEVCGHEKHSPLATPPRELNDSSLVLQLPAEYHVRSLAGHKYGNHTVLFLGTAKGNVLKVLVDSFGYQAGKVFDSIAVDPLRRPITKLILSPNNHYVYALANATASSGAPASQLFKVPVSECSRFKTCSACTSAKSFINSAVVNPLCGWCVYTGICTHRGSCTKPAGAIRPFHQNDSLCPAILSISPTLISHMTYTMIRVHVAHLPLNPPGSRYECQFGATGQRAPTLYNASSGEYSCVAPRFNISQGLQDIQFGFYLAATKSKFLSFDGLKGFNCRVNTRCDSCLSTVAPCGWCRYTNRCTISKNECADSRLDTAWTMANVETVCPVTTPLHVQQPVQRSLVFPIDARNLPTPRAGTLDTYECVLKSSDGQSDETMQAQLTKNPGNAWRVRCQLANSRSVEMLRDAGHSWTEKRLLLLWNGVDISGEQFTKVAFYNCETLAKGDCSLCVSQQHVPETYPLASRFQCRWCSGEGKCKVDANCWNDSRRCPSPVVTKISPNSGPLEGGTLVVINGTNLGSQRSDLSQVRVNEAECAVKSYTPARGLECETGKRTVTEGPGVVTVSLYGNTRSSANETAVMFDYILPEFRAVHPAMASESGGSLITLSGSGLDTGRDVEVELAGQPCRLANTHCHHRPPALCQDLPKIPRNRSTIWCYASPYTLRQGGKASGYVKLKIDGFESTLSSTPFFYYRDPVVHGVGGVTPTSGIISGGIELKIRGRHFSAVRDMGIMLRDTTDEITTENSTLCLSRTNTTARCLLPGFSYTTPYARLVLLHDGHQTEIANNFGVAEDPIIEDSKFLGDASNNLMQVSGQNLDSVAETEYRIYVGDIHKANLCAVSSVEGETIICQVPRNLSSQGRRTYMVTIDVGRDLRFDVGPVEFLTASAQEQQDKVTGIAGGVAGGAAFLLIIFLLLFIYCQQRARVAENEVLRMINRMENLESSVATECRSAFTDLMTDLGDHGISTADDNLPYLSFHQYAIRSLFPNAGDDHPSLQPLGQRLKHLGPSRLEHTRRTLATFQRSLVYNKKFLVTFIHAMEAHFSMKDRVAFASILMVALHDKMEYATEVLKCLLADLIKASVQRSHPMLLLRRMETVAEKLLANWLTFCLYDYIRMHAGRPLYMLYQAVKSQTERGPCDALTGEARYSLSEEKLLREPVEYKELMCTFHRGDEGSSFPVRLQDCDTISQAKEKIMDATYKTSPVSMRPDLASIDLAMDTGDSSSSPTILRDEDITTVQEGYYKRINTLTHYGVPNGANLRFVKRGAQSGKSERSGDFIGTMVFAPPTQLTLPMNDDGMKPYHLVKQTEYELPPERQTVKMVHEVFLTRLLFTKNVLQRFVNDLFCKMFSMSTSSKTTPPVPEAVKYLFDFLEQQASENGIDEPDVVHTWKNNSVPLRFWINIIKNPDFVFDIHKSATVDSSLSVVAQMVMDSCGTADQRLTKESPTTKLLYAKEVQTYRKLVEKYYADIQAMPVILEGRMHDILQQVSVGPDRGGFHKDSAMYDVFIYGLHYRDSVAAALKKEGLLDLMRQFEETCDELAHGFDEKSSSL